VVQQIAQAIRSSSAHPPPIFLDEATPRVLCLKRAITAQKAALQVKSGAHRAFASVEAYVKPFDCRCALRVELLKDEAISKPPKEVLLLLTAERLELYAERPSLFALPALMDFTNPKEREVAARRGDGLDAFALHAAIPIADITSIELEMSAEPRARIGYDSSEVLPGDPGATLLLSFADDTGAMLWRFHMRQALWGTGAATWTGKSLGGERR